tara:strand:- start:63 stop:1082 length:1020 start_codon:yes stop_codon:yes gene_type:complete
MTESYLHILVEAKREYTGQLASILTSPMYEGIASIYKHAYNTVSKEKILIHFQELLSKIPNWNNETLEREFQRIMLYSKCEWLSDLITAVFVSHTKVLTSIHLGNKRRDIELKIPTPIHFIHTIYVNIAREFWKNPYLMYDIDVSASDKQRNLRDSENIIKECIHSSIRKLLPVRHIIREYLGDTDNKSIYTEDITSTLSNVHIEQIKKMVEVDMQNINIDNRQEDYTNTLPDDDVESVLTIQTINNDVENVKSGNSVEEKVQLEESFNKYSAEEEEGEGDTFKENIKMVVKNVDENVDEDDSSSSMDRKSTLSTLSRRLRLLRTHDRPRKKPNLKPIF